MVRPTSWHTKIVAPPEALEFYEILSRVSNIHSTAFAECHIFTGAVSSVGTPVMFIGGKTTPIPALLSGFLMMALSQKRLCQTRGCCNPLHYMPEYTGGVIKDRTFFIPEPTLPEIPGEIPLQELVDLVTYVRDRKAIARPLSYNELRNLIPEEDMTEIDFQRAYEALPEDWKLKL